MKMYRQSTAHTFTLTHTQTEHILTHSQGKTHAVWHLLRTHLSVIVVVVIYVVVVVVLIVMILLLLIVVVVAVLCCRCCCCRARRRHTRSGQIAPPEHPHDCLTHPTPFSAFAIKCHLRWLFLLLVLCCCCCCSGSCSCFCACYSSCSSRCCPCYSSLVQASIALSCRLHWALFALLAQQLLVGGLPVGGLRGVERAGFKLYLLLTPLLLRCCWYCCCCCCLIVIIFAVVFLAATRNWRKLLLWLVVVVAVFSLNSFDGFFRLFCQLVSASSDCQTVTFESSFILCKLIANF